MIDSTFPLPAGLPADPALLATLLDLLPMGVIYYTPVVDSTGTLTDLTLAYLNPAAQRMTQLPAQPGTTYRQQFPTTDANGAWDFHRRSWLGPKPGYFQFYYDADGFDSYFRVTTQRLGEGLLSIFTDTQDEVRGQVEQALLASQARERAARAEAEAERQRFQEVLMQLPAQVAVNSGPDHVFSLVNAPYQQMFPTRPVQGLPVREALPELEGQQFFDMLDHVYQTGEPFFGRAMPASVDFTNTGRLELRYVDVFFKALHDAQGQVDGVLNFSYDVTEQVLARQQVEQLNQELEVRVQQRTADLQKSEKRFRTMADAAPAMLWVTDPDGQCTYLNAQWYQYTGQTEVEALGMGWTQAVHPDDAEQAGQKFLEANAQRTRFYLRYRLRRHDGIYRWAIDMGHPHFAEDGAFAGFVGTVIDIHEQQLAEDELHAANAQLTRTNIDLDTFVYTASHDLKAPITNIESIVLALRDTLALAGQPNDMVAHLLDLLDETTARFQFTIAQLADLAKLQRTHAGPAELVQLAAVVESVCLDLAPSVVKTDARLTVDVAPDLIVSFSPANLRSTIYNLLSNAIKYRAPDRPVQIHIRAEPTPQGVVLTVADNGLGLSEHQVGRLFGLFQRLHDHVEGTGVGLYITKRLVENGGGSIAVESKLNAGTTFTVMLPA